MSEVMTKSAQGTNVLTDQSVAMWEMFVGKLAASGGIGGLSPKTYIPTSGLSPANWEFLDTSGLGKGTPGDIIPANLISWADSMPVWGPSYVPGLKLYNQYSAFLRSIKLKGGDPAQQQIATILSEKVDVAQTDLSKTQGQMFKEWTEYDAAQKAIPVAAQTEYVAWYNQNYAATMSAKQNALASVQMNYMSALQKVGGPDAKTLSDAIGKLALSANAGNAIEDEAHVLWPKYTITGGLNKWFLSALANVDKEPQCKIEIELSQSSQYHGEKSSYINTNVQGGYSSFFWGGGASSSYQQSKKATDYASMIQEMKMTYTAQSLEMFTVNPGNWFDSAIVSAFYDQIDPASALANKPLFGENGILNLETKQLLVAFRPEVTLEGKNDQISAVSNTFHQASQSSFSIGGWFWGGSASVNQGQDDSSAKVEVSKNGNKVTFKYNSNTPKVIGMVPLNLNPKAPK